MSNTVQTTRFGVLGTARIATKVGAAIHKASNAELTAVASRDAQRAAAWADEHGATRSYGSYAALIDDPDLDAIYIPLPPSMHAEWTIKAAEAGKHVLCEKPLAMSVTETEEMAAACRENNVQLLDGVMWVHHPRADDMRKPIVDGSLGTVRRMTSAFTFNNDLPLTDLRMQRELGGGSMLDLGWYCVRATLWAFGELPRRVWADARYKNDVDVNFSGLMWYDNDRMASFDSAFDTGLRKWFEVAGTEASLVCDDFVHPWDESKPRFWLHNPDGKMEERVSTSDIQEVKMVECLANIAQTGELEDLWTNDAIATQRICDALDQSARSGKIVELAE